MPSLKLAQWTGTRTGVAGAVRRALHIGAVAAGFTSFRISSAPWSPVGWIHRDPSLLVLQGDGLQATGDEATIKK